MITAEEAYRIIKKNSKKPVTYLIESEELFLSTGEEYLCVRKDSGEIGIIRSYVDFIIKIHHCKYIALEEMFEDYMEYYKKHNNEQTLAELYALVWNRLFYHKYKDDSLVEYNNSEEKQSIITEWTKIEQALYTDIIGIMENENFHYPPCVLNKFNDPFYRIKPFMIRNGWTDNDVDKTWIHYEE